MIKSTFRLGGEVVEVVVRGNEVLFHDTSSQMITTIEGLRLSKSGCIKEFPDLEGDSNWKKKTIERWKEYIKKMASEMDKIIYIKNELKKHGYIPLFYQRAGWREQKFKDGK